ncbi:MAG: hypothetical protein Q4E17_00380 [Synergistes sp.]|nr:hypothetical protein [Synergistes sp.]
MIISLYGKKHDLIKVKYGFSWTVLFFGFFAPFFRRDIKWGAIMFVATIGVIWLTVELHLPVDMQPFCLYIAQILFSFIYNNIYIKELLAKGYMPYDNVSRTILIENGYLTDDFDFGKKEEV